MVIQHLLSSSSESANSLRVSANFSISSSFSSLQTTLMHFGGGRCCYGCLPLKCGCAGGAVGDNWTGFGIVEAPRISVITNSSCWAIMLTSFCLISVDALRSFFILFSSSGRFFLFLGCLKTNKAKITQIMSSLYQKISLCCWYLASFKLLLKAYEYKNDTSHHTCTEFNHPSDVPWCLWFDYFFSQSFTSTRVLRVFSFKPISVYLDHCSAWQMENKLILKSKWSTL